MKAAVVTGTSYGLGKAIAETLLNDGYKVYGVSRTESGIKNDNFVWIKADLLKEECFDLIKSSVSESKVDILVNNAGTHIEEKALDFSNANFDKMFGLNFVAPIKVTKTLSEKLSWAFVINISSTSDRFVWATSGLYSASKAALEIFFETLAEENKKMKVVHILPSYVDTPLQHKISDSVRDFDWELCTTPEEDAKFLEDLINEKFDLPSGSRVMLLNNKTMEDTRSSEKLFYYNTDTKEFKKLN